MKQEVYDIIKMSRKKSKDGKIYDYIIILFIVINIMACIIDTFGISEVGHIVVKTIEWITIIGFTIEYFARIWTADMQYPKIKIKTLARVRYIFSFWGIIDLLSFFPFYLPFFFPNGIMVFRMLRIMRVIKIFKISKKNTALEIIGKTVKETKNQLISSVFIIFILMIASSLCMYDLEHEAQPEVFDNAFSGLWWATSAIFTVGYGDIYPITIEGKIAGMIISMLGVGLVAIPTGIIFAGFVEQLDKERRKDKKCPHCGEKLE